MGNEAEEIKIFEGSDLKIENYAFDVVEDEKIEISKQKPKMFYYSQNLMKIEMI